jgi:hypothetical protein
MKRVTDNSGIKEEILKKYKIDELMKHPNTSETMRNNFLNFVVPSLASSSRHDNVVKWKCMFTNCCQLFSTKQTLVRHLICKHGDQLPNDGIFLSPNSNYYKKFECGFCSNNFFRRDHFNSHLTKCHSNIANKDSDNSNISRSHSIILS